MRNAPLTVTLLGLTLFATSPLHADATWTLGAVVVGTTGPYVGQEDEAELLSYFAFETDRFEVSVTDGLTYDVFQGDGPDGEGISASLRLAPRWSPDFGDDPLFDGLERDTAIEAGAELSYGTRAFVLSAEILTDISDVHNGYQATVFAGAEVELGPVILEGGIGARHRSSDLNQYLFGVTAAEATTARAAYSPGDSTTGFASLTAILPLSDTMALIGDVTFEDLGTLSASPLVSDDQRTSVAFGLVYRF